MADIFPSAKARIISAQFENERRQVTKSLIDLGLEFSSAAYSAMNGLEKIGTRDSIRGIAKLLQKHNNPHVMRDVIYTFGRMGIGRCIEVLSASPKEMPRQSFLELLRAMQVKFNRPSTAYGILPEEKDLIKSKIEELERVGVDASIPSLSLSA